jgi:hypothetical protein
MTAYWKRIILNQFKAGNKTDEEVRGYVPKLITQDECTEILNAV